MNNHLAFLKIVVKKNFPALYTALCKTKDAILPPRRQWGKYYDADPNYEWLKKPERCLVELKPHIPSHIDTILNLGCGAGRDFIPFDGELKLWGLDIVPFERIKWLRSFKNFTYTQAYLEDFTKELEAGKYDLSHVLVYSHGTLMYLTKRDQERFFQACKKSGATVFIFSEYPEGGHENEEFFKLDPAKFTIRRFRPEGETLVFTSLHLD
ncbi:MAG: Methyltransferase domain [Candidatus Parcubacteria bacterium]|jgi:SAM-dependent methyltransferase